MIIEIISVLIAFAAGLIFGSAFVKGPVIRSPDDEILDLHLRISGLEGKFEARFEKANLKFLAASKTVNIYHHQKGAGKSALIPGGPREV